VSNELAEVDVTSPVPVLPDLAKMPAITRLSEALVKRGFRKNTAQAIAVAVVDPSEARRQLEQPSVMRVSGGQLEVIYVDTWVPAILPYPENPRMLPGLTYAVESHAGRRHPLPPARPMEDTSTELVMEPVRSVDLVEHLDSQVRYLKDNNDLTTSVGDHGILEPLLLVPLTFERISSNGEPIADVDAARSKQDWPTILTSVDGNSRLTAAYKNLRLDPGEAVTKMLGSPRAIRQRVGNTLALQTERAALTYEAEQALRSLTAPSAIIVGFTPSVPGRDLADGIQARLGALHVAPPKPWNAASKFDLLLNVSLDALQEHFDLYGAGIGVSGEDYREWLAGNLTAQQAADVGLDPEADFRSAALRFWFRNRDRDISAAIRRLDIASKVTPAMRANIAAEGAIRSFRSSMSANEADNARRVLAALYQLDDLSGDWGTQDDEGLGDVRAALREATAEIVATGRPGPSARVLMLLAFYWIARYRIVPLQTRGGQADRRKIVDVLTMMCRTEHGMRALAQVVLDGRNGIHPRAVSANGIVEQRNGEDVPLTDDWIRRTWSRGRALDLADSPQKDLENRSLRLAELVQDVKGALVGMREPSAGDGLPLIETIGLELTLAQALLDDLDEIRDGILEWRLISKRANRVQGDSPN
jgi:hypothetical protein